MYNIPVPGKKKWIEPLLKISSVVEIVFINTNNLIERTFNSSAYDLFLEAPKKYSVRSLLLKDMEEHRRLYFFKGKKINMPFIEKKRLTIKHLKDQSGKSDSGKDLYIRIQKDIYKFIVNSSLYEDLVFDSCYDYEFDKKVNSAIKQYEDVELRNEDENSNIKDRIINNFYNKQTITNSVVENNLNIQNINFEQPRNTSSSNKSYSKTKDDDINRNVKSDDVSEKPDRDVKKIEFILPKDFIYWDNLFKNNEIKYFEHCSMFKLNNKPNPSALILWEQMKFDFYGEKQGISIINKKRDDVYKKLKALYPNSIRSNTLSRPTFNDIIITLSNAINNTLTGSEKEKNMINDAYVISKIMQKKEIEKKLALMII